MHTPEQKSIAVMNTLVDKYSQPFDIFYDSFDGSYAIGRACVFLPLHMRCIIGDVDDDCSKFAKMKLVEAFARQLLKPESDITGTAALQNAAMLLLHPADNINSKKYSNIWSTPPVYPPFQLFLPEVIRFLCSIHKDYSLYLHGLQLPINHSC